MVKPDNKTVLLFFVVILVFAVISFLLTCRVILHPSLVLGDNFYWSKPTITDVLGLKVVLESYLGSANLLSAFRTGFLLPSAYVLSLTNLPFTILYPLLFYVFSMLAFYSLSMEFLQSKALGLVASVIYVVNPVIPYYFTSLLTAFALVFLPLALKFFIRALRNLGEWSKSSYAMKDFALSGVFLALSVSAHPQFFLSAALIALMLVIAFLVVCFRNYGKTSRSVVFALTSISLAAVSFAIINIPLLVSLYNIGCSPSATYYTGRFGDFMANTMYSYSTADPFTLLRFGGDSGTGLGLTSWYDSATYTNAFGYSIFVVFLLSLYLLASRKDIESSDRVFFYMNATMFTTALFLILIMKFLPNSRILAEGLFSFVLQTWESPAKLRVVLFLSALTTTLVAFRYLESLQRRAQRKIVKATLILVLVSSTVVYNSPWLINYAGFSPMQQIADNLRWGSLFDDNYAKLAQLLATNYSDDRGLIIPYTHKAELYVPPNFRLFQLVSPINEDMTRLAQSSQIAWSELVGLLSAKYIVLNNNYKPGEGLIFPTPRDGNMTRVLEEIKNDSGLTVKEKFGNYTIFENENQLPELYATSRFVFYDDIGTLKYAIVQLSLKDLPVFIGSEGEINRFSVPSFVSKHVYEVNAVTFSDSRSAPTLSLIVSNADYNNTVNLDKTATWSGVALFSAVCSLYPGDTVRVPDAESWNETQRISSLHLNSTAFSLGQFGSFTLDFRVNLLERGEYSFLAPRVVVEVGNSTKYFVIFQDNGALELALLDGDVWRSCLMTRYLGYSLERESDSIDVTISRIFDEVHVYVNGELAMSFPTEPMISTVYLSSEQSVSRFTNVSIKTRNILRLFASRQSSRQPLFWVESHDPNACVLEVSNEDTEYAVVSQYLYTQLRGVEVPCGSNEIRANVFFQGWTLNADGSDSKRLSIALGIRTAPLTVGLTLFSVFLTYLIVIAQIAFVRRKLSGVLSKPFNRLKTMIKRGETETNA